MFVPISASGGKSPEEVWSEHLKKENSLKAYASSMCTLATGPWAKHGGGRIKWCIETCLEYFHGGKLEQLIKKDIRRASHGNPTLLETGLMPNDADVGELVAEFSTRQLCVLDVGSCYNPFSIEKRFSVTAIDIAPAVEVWQKDCIHPSPFSLVLSCSFFIFAECHSV